MAMEWTDELIARLKELWGQGLSTAEIGRQLSITKNAVVGKAHRLGLPPRPSPIRNKTGASADGAAKPARPRTPRAKKADAAQASSASEEQEAASSAAAAQGKAVSSEGSAPSKAGALARETAAEAPSAKGGRGKAAQEGEAATAAAPVAPPRKMAPPRRVREVMDRSVRQGPTCQWPLGDPGTPEFHFCGATPLPGKPYCAEHAAIAYVKIRDRRH